LALPDCCDMFTMAKITHKLGTLFE